MRMHLTHSVDSARIFILPTTVQLKTCQLLPTQAIGAPNAPTESLTCVKDPNGVACKMNIVSTTFHLSAYGLTAAHHRALARQAEGRRRAKRLSHQVLVLVLLAFLAACCAGSLTYIGETQQKHIQLLQQKFWNHQLVSCSLQACTTLTPASMTDLLAPLRFLFSIARQVQLRACCKKLKTTLVWLCALTQLQPCASSALHQPPQQSLAAWGLTSAWNWMSNQRLLNAKHYYHH